MGFWRIERAGDGFVAVVEAATREQAEELFDTEHGLDEDSLVNESDAAEYAEFKRNEANDTPWYS